LIIDLEPEEHAGEKHPDELPRDLEFFDAIDQTLCVLLEQLCVFVFFDQALAFNIADETEAEK